MGILVLACDSIDPMVPEAEFEVLPDVVPDTAKVEQLGLFIELLSEREEFMTRRSQLDWKIHVTSLRPIKSVKSWLRFEYTNGQPRFDVLMKEVAYANKTYIYRHQLGRERVLGLWDGFGIVGTYYILARVEDVDGNRTSQRVEISFREGGDFFPLAPGKIWRYNYRFYQPFKTYMDPCARSSTEIKGVLTWEVLEAQQTSPTHTTYRLKEVLDGELIESVFDQGTLPEPCPVFHDPNYVVTREVDVVATADSVFFPEMPLLNLYSFEFPRRFWKELDSVQYTGGDGLLYNAVFDQDVGLQRLGGTDLAYTEYIPTYNITLIE